MSLPARGAWIEIAKLIHRLQMGRGRSPHGERGLKCSKQAQQHMTKQSLPARGAWIEIRSVCMRHLGKRCRSPHGERGLKLRVAHISGVSVYSRSPHGERGLKCKKVGYAVKKIRSLPARGAWIEISGCPYISRQCVVAPRTGSVD